MPDNWEPDDDPETWPDNWAEEEEYEDYDDRRREMTLETTMIENQNKVEPNRELASFDANEY